MFACVLRECAACLASFMLCVERRVFKAAMGETSMFMHSSVDSLKASEIPDKPLAHQETGFSFSAIILHHAVSIDASAAWMRENNIRAGRPEFLIFG